MCNHAQVFLELGTDTDNVVAVGVGHIYVFPTFLNFLSISSGCVLSHGIYCTHIYLCIYFTPRYFPFGIVFLIAGKILEMDDPSAIGKKLGFYAITVVCGLVVHGLFILPMMYFFITKKNPIVFIRGILQALLIALATSSRYNIIYSMNKMLEQ